MLKSMKRLFFLIFISLFANTVSAQEDNPCKPCGCDTACLCDPILESEFPCLSGFNSPLRYASCYGYFVSASYLYWSANMQSFTLGTMGDNLNNFPGSATVIDFDNTYNSTFQVTGGMQLFCDVWQTFIDYTRYHQTFVKNESVPEDSTQRIFPFWVTPDQTDVVNSVNGTWKLGLDLIDWYLSRQYYVGQFLVVKPFVGIRGMILDNSLRATYEVQNSIDSLISSNSTKSWGIGPRIGSDTWWTFCGNLRVYARASAGLVFQNFYRITKNNVELTTFGSSSIDLSVLKYSEKLNELCYDVQFSLGVGYEDYVSYDRWHYDITIGYDFNRILDQNVFRRFQTVTDNTILYGDLILQGLTVKLALDF